MARPIRRGISASAWFYATSFHSSLAASARVDEVQLRHCTCADPEHCTQPVEGYICRRGLVAPETPEAA